MTPDAEIFRPPRGLRNAHVQSVLASSGLRRWRIQSAGPLIAAQREEIVHCEDGTRLRGFHSPQQGPSPGRGLVILLHGWEGCHESTYMLRTGDHLYRMGYDVFRLNFRDHGDSHALNEALFHSCRIDEVVLAVAEVARRHTPRPLFLVGFSLGGNFALRVALRAPRANIPLSHVVSVSPVISPHSALDAIESAPRMYETYFLRKWRRSLRTKQAAFPDRYEMDEWLRYGGLRKLTEDMVLRYTDFPGIDDYLNGYSIAGDTLAPLEIPASVITSADDPIIPVDDYRGLERHPALDLVITRFGGHCGFVRGWRMGGWIEQEIGRRLSQVRV